MSKFNTNYFEQRADPKGRDFKEACLSAIVVILGEIRDELWEIKEIADKNRVDCQIEKI